MKENKTEEPISEYYYLKGMNEEKPSEEKKTAEEYFHLSKNEFGKMWLMYNPEGGGRYKCWEPIAGEFWNEFEKLQNAAQETAALREENERLKEVVKELIYIASDLLSTASEHVSPTEEDIENYKLRIENAKKLTGK